MKEEMLWCENSEKYINIVPQEISTKHFKVLKAPGH